MKTYTNLPGFCEDDGCPVHGAEVVKTYDFGCEDAEVIKFACRCCVSINRTDACLGGDGRPVYHTSYQEAAGRARLIVAGEESDNACFS